MRSLGRWFLLWSGFSALTCQADPPDPVLLGIPFKPQISVMGMPQLKAEAWGFIDLVGHTVVPPSWSYVEPFWKGHAFVIQNGKWGMIDATGKLVIESEWDRIGAALPNRDWEVTKGGKCFVIDADGNIVRTLDGDDLPGDPSEGLRRFVKNKKVGFMDETGKIVIAPEWDAAADFTEGLAMVVKDKKEGFLDPAGKLAIDPSWDYDNLDDNFSEGVANVKRGGKWGFIDKTGTLVVPATWDSARSFKNGLAQVERDKKWGFIDKTGREVVSVKWDYACLFSEGLSMVQLDNKRGYVDATGKVVIEPQWPTAGLFQGGLAAVEVNGKCGFIDKSGKLVIPPHWDLTDMGGADDVNFRDGRAQIRVDGKIGLIDTTGKFVVAPEWDRMDWQPPYYNSGCFVTRFADHSFKVPSNGEINQDLNGFVTPEMLAKQKLWQSYQPAEAAWFDRDGKMIWHSWP